mgnify:CR=1 FL=1
MLTTPLLTPVTSPVELTVATVGLPLVHEPPAGVAVSNVEEPMHNVLLPEITAEGFTVTVKYP